MPVSGILREAGVSPRRTLRAVQSVLRAIATAVLLCLAANCMAAAADNNIEWSGVYSSRWERSPAWPLPGTSWITELRVFRKDLTSARINTHDSTGTTASYALAFNRNETVGGIQYDWYRVTVPASVASYFSYYFELHDGTATAYYSSTGMSSAVPARASEWFIGQSASAGLEFGANYLNGITTFRVWAPDATAMTVKGTWNSFSDTAMPLTKNFEYFCGSTTLAHIGDQYVFHITSSSGTSDKQDARSRDLTSSVGNSNIRTTSTFTWNDSAYVRPALSDAIVYELHVGTFSGLNDGVSNAPAKFRDVVDAHLADLVSLGITAVEIMPSYEYPVDWSWGYNPCQPYAPESAYGSPDDLKYMIEKFHEAGIAVILDVVYNHLGPSDLELWNYDGQQQYFYTDSRANTPWGDTRPDYTKREVLDFLLGNLRYFLDEFHADGFRFDGTDYIKAQGAGPEGWEFLRQATNLVRRHSPGAYLIAEQLPNDYGVTRDYGNGGAGFDVQWSDPMHDNLKAALIAAAFGDPNMGSISSAMRATGFDSPSNTLNYIESHDEVASSNGNRRIIVDIDSSNPHSIYAKSRSKVGVGIVLTATGTPMLFMGEEQMEDKPFDATAANRVDWSYKTTYANMRKFYIDAIAMRKAHPALRSTNINVYHLNETSNVLGAYRSASGDDLIIIASLSNSDFNVYKVGAPLSGTWTEILNSNSTAYDGTGIVNGTVTAQAGAYDGFSNSISVNLPARTFIVLKHNTATSGIENFNAY